MRGLLKTLAPFAPDQSGVVSALYGLDGLLVICDAGGCTGNICGFDEPRWFAGQGEKPNAIFSAGLRDMDAILGRDELLIEKLADAADHLDASFAALIGTPVPAVIATDFDALRNMAKERTGLPVLTFPCTGTRLYDVGERDAYLELFRTFAGDSAAGDKKEEHTDACVQRESEKAGVLGVIGCTPLDISRTEPGPALEQYVREQGHSQAYCYGMGAGLAEVRRAGSVEKNLIVAPAGIAAAEYLQETYGTPYEVAYPFFSEAFRETLRGLIADSAEGAVSGEASSGGKRILIVHQQVAANEIRRILRGGNACDETDPAAQPSGTGTEIVCGTWFLQLPELTEPGDVTFDEEEQFASYVEDGQFDVVIGDPRFRRALRNFDGEFIDCPHFAVSGILEEE